jgi:Bacterial antitoxin of type II TA system, VapB
MVRDEARPTAATALGDELGDLAPHKRMCDNSHMATNLAIDDRLLEEARRIGGQKTKRATVTEALSEYIQRRKQQQIVELFGKLDVDPKYDYKKQRRRK